MKTALRSGVRSRFQEPLGSTLQSSRSPDKNTHLLTHFPIVMLFHHYFFYEFLKGNF